MPKVNVRHGPVEYYDPKNDSSLCNEPDKDLWFYKTKKYQAQDEYRISFQLDREEKNFNTELTYKLNTGAEIFCNIQAIKLHLQNEYTKLVKFHEYS